MTDYISADITYWSGVLMIQVGFQDLSQKDENGEHRLLSLIKIKSHGRAILLLDLNVILVSSLSP